MRENKMTTDNAEKISAEFHVFCRKVIRRSVLNQLRGYVRYCKNYGTVPLEETEESAMAVYDDVLEGKVKIPVCGTVILIGDEKLAAALLEMQDTKREIVLRNTAFGYSLSEIAGQLELEYDTVRHYKSNAMKELRGKVGIDAEKE